MQLRPATWQHSQFFNSGGSLQTEVNGQARQGNSYQIEGIDDDERTGLLQILVPPAEAIQTVDVSTNNFEAELGRASGGVTNVVVKSGSNNLHGGAYEFLQNSDLDARTFFNATVGHVAYNYFGGNAGGPIKKNKLFFFGDYLRIDDHEANTNLVTVPSVLSRTGNLSEAPTVIYDPATGITPTGTLASSNFDVIPTDFKNTYAESWNVALQRALPGHFTLDVAYVGNHGVRTPTNYNLNASFLLNSGNAGDLFFPRTQSYTERWRGFSSSYDSLQVKFDHRYYKGLSITTAFTWQKAMSMQTDDDGNLLWYIGTQRNWAREDFDRTLNFIQSYVYELPIGPGKALLSNGLASKIIGGWQVAGILTMLTGTPFYISANGGALNTPGETQTANQVAPVQILHGINTGNPWFSTASFTQPVGAGVFGTSGRNILSGPGMFRIDFSMFKNFQLSERFKMEIRAESFDLTNTPAFSNPNGSCCSSNNANFGVVTGTVGSGTGVNGTGAVGRAFQLGAKLTF